MKNTFMFVFLCGLALCVISCKEKEDRYFCEGTRVHQDMRPENLKPIDWESYNDVYTVHWTYAGRCCCEEWVLRDADKHIKVYGWLHRGYLFHNPDLRLVDAPFFLVDDV